MDIGTVTATYLGFTMQIGNRTVSAFTPDGHLICEARSLSSARACIRAYRRTQPRDFEYPTEGPKR